MKKVIAIFFLSLISACSGFAIEIQLNNNRNSENKPEMEIGYVDVNSLFSEHPMTARLKQDFLKEAAKRKQDMLEIHRTIKADEGIIISTATEIKTLRLTLESLKQGKTQQSSSTETVKKTNYDDEIKNTEISIADKEKAIETLKGDIEKKKANFICLKRKIKKI